VKTPNTQYLRIIDLDVDIGADAVDYKCALSCYCTFERFSWISVSVLSAIANQDGLSALEVEMRKLEGVVGEVVDELIYLREREERFAGTNSEW
jgi:hypothetical protein